MISYFSLLIFSSLLISVNTINVMPTAIGASQIPRTNDRVFNEEIGDNCSNPTNQIVSENCKQGTLDWKIYNYLNDIEGFASKPSVNLGESIDFYVNTSADKLIIKIFRSGYYNGEGGRLIIEIPDLPGNIQPSCNTDNQSGLISCKDWTISYHQEIPENWISGIYIAKLIRTDTGGENYILFVIRDDDRESDVLYQQSSTTYQAYNNYGGKSLYSQISTSCITESGAPRAVKVSFDRPYQLAFIDDYNIYNPNSYLWAEYPMVSWLEAQGYDVTYSTNLDTHRSGKPDQYNELLDHQVFLSVGHDEYWTQEMRDAVAAARDAGVHLGFFSANTMFKRIRLEPDPWSSEPEKVIVSYKTYEGGPVDPSGQSTSTWRDPEGPNFPENELIGVQYIGDNDSHYFPLRITDERAKDRIYRNTGLEEMPLNSYIDIGEHIVGWEWDAVVDNGHTPQNLAILAETPVNGPILLDAGSTYNLGASFANTTRYIAPNGSIVFAAGTNQWSWGLAIVEPNEIIQQITYNLLADMGVNPASPTHTLVLDGEEFKNRNSVNSINDLFHNLEFGSGPVISNLNAISDENKVAITWDTNIPAIGQVWVKSFPGEINYRQTDHPYWIIPIPAYADQNTIDYQHEISILLNPSLKPTTLYYYQVASTDEYGRTTISPEKSFRISTISPIVRVKMLVRPIWISLPCWLRNNLFPAGILFVAIFTLLILSVALFLIRRRSS